MRIIALGALVALASGCFASADEVSARELRARAAERAAIADLPMPRRDTSHTFVHWVSDVGPADRSPGFRPVMAVESEAAR